MTSLVYFLRLTAFVMRVFCQAQKFAGVNIDQDLVCTSVGWLVANQRADGALPEVNAVIHREMVVRNQTLTYQGRDLCEIRRFLEKLHKCSSIRKNYNIKRSHSCLSCVYN